ncbi:hypothetical protein BDR07DRAFT_1391268 [Suillus spraguei]|nr:hypothetical protein BDR07DRAFT_1391268 [Suillus spraguei]
MLCITLLHTLPIFGCELGAQTSFDDKNECYIINGIHDASGNCLMSSSTSLCFVVHARSLRRTFSFSKRYQGRCR